MAAAATPTPRSLNVQQLAEARRSELQSLHALVSSRLSERFRLPRSLRRRTTSHVRRCKRRRRSEALREEEGEGEGEGEEEREEGKEAEEGKEEEEEEEEQEEEEEEQEEGKRRLETHVWHAKRFEMAERWGWWVPMGRVGAGRGKVKEAAVVHDASYCLPLLLQGPQASLLSALTMLLLPSPPPPPHAASHHHALLYHHASSPSPPHSHLIAPVNYMWHPIHMPQCHNSSSIPRTLCIWIHAAAFHHASNALTAACHQHQVTCLPLQHRIARLDVMGAKASQLLTKILCPLTSSDETTDGHLVPRTTSVAHKHFNVDQFDKLPPGGVLTLRVKDPRLLSSEFSSEPVPVDLHSLDTCKLYDNSELWASHCRINPPVPDNILCRQKNKRRLNTFFLKPTSQEMPAGQEKDGFHQSCTVILLKHAYQATFLGWSIILPLSWVKPFWLSMVSKGGHAIGLREKRWVAWKNKVPSFPHDFPDTEAYKSLLADQDALVDASTLLRHHTRQPQKTPMSPPWDCVVASCHHICSNAVQWKVPTFYVYVPRTIKALKDCVEKMGSSDLASPGGIGITDDRREKGSLCLVRVLVRAFKEGFFEEGAVVCAPCTDDLSGWNTRSPEEVGEYQEKWQIQLAQSAVESYFVRVESGRWALQVPEDPVNLKSFRWPIGFITTGAVHACNDRVAIAFCDIRILAALRRQQYLQTQTERPEIFVLVRNMKSTAYRRAIATIVLEQQQDDVLFL